MSEHPAADGVAGQQPFLDLPVVRPARSTTAEVSAARVVVDTPLAHLDRPFEYAVDPVDDVRVVTGVRVRVRLAGRDHDGFVLDRVAQPSFTGELTPLRRVVSDEPVVTPHIFRMARAVADHYGGTLADVLRLAIPPRHARAERDAPPPSSPSAPSVISSRQSRSAQVAAWRGYPAGKALLRRLADGEAPAASFQALPGRSADTDWPAALAEAAAATLAGGRGSVLVVPDHRDLERVAQALTHRLGSDQHVRLSADLGPAERYRAWLSVLRGHQQVVVGTRSAIYAPVRRPGLFAIWDDGDDLHSEPRSPYPHVREVARVRAADTGAGLLVGGFVPTPECRLWVEQGWMRPVTPDPASLRAHRPRVLVAGEGDQAERDPAAASARIPSLAWRAARDALARGPVLVQVPRRGYAMGLTCEHCRHPVRCVVCAGPTAVPGPGAPASCRWCARPIPSTPCEQCGARGRRAGVSGDERTAEELGRAFAGVPVRTSRAGQVLAEVDDRPALVVATAGAEPVAQGGYAAVLLLDGWALLARAGLGAAVEAARRWAGAAALSRPGPDGGQVVLVGVPPHGGVRPVEALVRWDPAWLVDAELSERTALGLPPARRVARVTGDTETIRDLSADAAAGADWLAGVELLGPVDAEARSGPDGTRTPQLSVVLRAPRDDSGAPGPVAASVRTLRSRRSMTKAPGHLTAVLDAVDVTP